MRKAHLLAAVLHKTGGGRALDLLWGPNRLTVLAYHRILDASDPGFDQYRPNVSASPAMFERQMDYVARRFNVIGLDALRAFIEQGEPLPSRPLLITFDDGYEDNYLHAFPVLRARGLPAVIFLITDFIGTSIWPWWDRCAYAFHHTTQPRAVLPLIGQRDLSAPGLRIAARDDLMRRLKEVPEAEKQAALEALGPALAVAPPESSLFMTWDQARELVAHGMACQPHTLSHPILTRTPPDEMRRQLDGSRARIETETGQPAVAFAYPNGTPADYSEAVFDALRDLGIRMAFTLTPGPMRLRLVRQRPLEIRRVFLSTKDTFDVFVMKIMGLPALPVFSSLG